VSEFGGGVLQFGGGLQFNVKVTKNSCSAISHISLHFVHHF
jgi:hypothetical protein